MCYALAIQRLAISYIQGTHSVGQVMLPQQLKTPTAKANTRKGGIQGKEAGKFAQREDVLEEEIQKRKIPPLSSGQRDLLINPIPPLLLYHFLENPLAHISSRHRISPRRLLLRADPQRLPSLATLDAVLTRQQRGAEYDKPSKWPCRRIVSVHGRNHRLLHPALIHVRGCKEAVVHEAEKEGDVVWAGGYASGGDQGYERLLLPPLFALRSWLRLRFRTLQLSYRAYQCLRCLGADLGVVYGDRVPERKLHFWRTAYSRDYRWDDSSVVTLGAEGAFYGFDVCDIALYDGQVVVNRSLVQILGEQLGGQF